MSYRSPQIDCDMNGLGWDGSPIPLTRSPWLDFDPEVDESGGWSIYHDCRNIFLHGTLWCLENLFLLQGYRYSLLGLFLQYRPIFKYGRVPI